MCKLRQRGRGYESCGISWDRHCSRPLQCCDGSGPKKAAPALGAGGNAGAVLMDGAASRHGFKLNPYASAVCPASDTLAGDRAPVAECDLLRVARHDVPELKSGLCTLGNCASGQSVLAGFLRV